MEAGAKRERLARVVVIVGSLTLLGALWLPWFRYGDFLVLFGAGKALAAVTGASNAWQRLDVVAPLLAGVAAYGLALGFAGGRLAPGMLRGGPLLALPQLLGAGVILYRIIEPPRLPYTRALGLPGAVTRYHVQSGAYVALGAALLSAFVLLSAGRRGLERQQPLAEASPTP